MLRRNRLCDPTLLYRIDFLSFVSQRRTITTLSRECSILLPCFDFLLLHKMSFPSVLLYSQQYFHCLILHHIFSFCVFVVSLYLKLTLSRVETFQIIIAYVIWIFPCYLTQLDLLNCLT